MSFQESFHVFFLHKNINLKKIGSPSFKTQI